LQFSHRTQAWKGASYDAQYSREIVSYARYGLPVPARVNAGTDLQKLIEDEQLGLVYVGNSVGELKRLAEHLADDDSLANPSPSAEWRWVARCSRPKPRRNRL
jgi:hypothetical protein